jgi:hypothetical protein
MMVAKRMSRTGRLVARAAVICGLLAGVALSVAARSTALRAVAGAPAKLTDRELWQLSVDASEPNGYFRSDNLTSNELGFERVIPELLSRVRPGTVYLGVGPEQNFTYMAATRPALAVIFDIRRGNLLVQLMYKALFELARDRADFVAMLFSKTRPAGLAATSSVVDLFAAFGSAESSETLYRQNLKAIVERLTVYHALPLNQEDRDGIERIYRVFFERGFAVRFSPTYVDLMTATDAAGAYRSYLASEPAYAFLRGLEAQNLVVPVVGDFAGPKAIRRVASFLKTHGTLVGTFYLSNVEQYLQNGKWATFCRNVATLPLDGSSTFIRSTSGRGTAFGPGFVSSLASMQVETRTCPAGESRP